MRKISTQSKGFLEKPEEAGEAMRLFKEVGIEGIDLSLNSYLKNMDVYNGSLKGYRNENVRKTTTYKAQLILALRNGKRKLVKAGLWPRKLKTPQTVKAAAKKAERSGFFDQSESELIRFFAPFQKAAGENGIVFAQAHAPYPIPISWSPDTTDYMKYEVIPKCMAICGYLQIPYLVLHPWFESEDKHTYEEVIDYVVSLKERCEIYGVMICLENIYETKDGVLVSGPFAEIPAACEVIDRINEQADKEICGVCLDTGHLKLTGGDILSAVEQLGTRLKCLHINDNNGKQDQHLLPNMEEAPEYGSLLQVLEKSGYSGVLNFEAFGSVRRYEDRATAARQLAAVGRQLNATSIEVEKAYETDKSGGDRRK